MFVDGMVTNSHSINVVFEKVTLIRNENDLALIEPRKDNAVG